MEQDYLAVCLKGLGWARGRDYFGYSKFDALNSPVLRLLAGRSRFLRSGFVFGVSRLPVNLRPWLGVRRRQNPKGLALFARAYLRLARVTGDGELAGEGRRLLEVLLGISQKGRYAGECWGYDHPWQNVAFFIPAYEPNTVVTCTVAEALLDAYEADGQERWLEAARSAARFVMEDLRYMAVGEGMLCCSYDLHSDWKVVNVNGMVAALLGRLWGHTREEELRERAWAHLRWVLSQQTGEGAWYYTDPPEASRITIDNYHTGFVLDSLGACRLRLGEDAAVAEAYERGLAYYRTELFEGDGAPKWMFDRSWPRDVHGAAQGVITFSRAAGLAGEAGEAPGRLGFARKVLDWALGNLYEPRAGRFYYQQGRGWTKRFTLMRWCQGWMCLALAEYLAARERAGREG